jgi:hypothetical protein
MSFDASAANADLTQALNLIGGRENTGDAATLIRGVQAQLRAYTPEDAVRATAGAQGDLTETVLHVAANNVEVPGAAPSPAPASVPEPVPAAGVAPAAPPESLAAKIEHAVEAVLGQAEEAVAVKS